jgi:hypothetical protein
MDTADPFKNSFSTLPGAMDLCTETKIGLHLKIISLFVINIWHISFCFKFRFLFYKNPAR